MMPKNGDRLTISPRGECHHLSKRDILSLVQADEGALVFAGGPLLSGHGNRFSDLDVYVIAETHPAAASFAPLAPFRIVNTARQRVDQETPGTDRARIVQHMLPGSSIRIDVEYLTFADIISLGRTLHDYYRRSLRNALLFPCSLGYRQWQLMARCQQATLLQGVEAFAWLAQQLPASQARYVRFRQLFADVSELLDILGAWVDQDFERGADLAREHLIKQVQAFLALKGCITPTRKYTLTHWRDLAPKADLGDVEAGIVLPRHVEDQKAYIRQAFLRIDRVRDLVAMALGQWHEPKPLAMQAVLQDEAAITASSGTYATWEFEYKKRVTGMPSRDLDWFLQDVARLDSGDEP